MARNARRNYVRDGRGRFSSTPGGGPARSTPASRRAAKPKRGALKPNGGTLTARARLKAARAKLTPGASRQQQAAVTRAKNRLKAAKAPVRMKTTTAGVKPRIAKPKGMKRDPQAAAKLAALQQGRRGRQPNARAQQAKAMANRTGVVSGRLRTDGQDTRTLSLAEMRRAVRQTLRKGGIETRKQFEKAYGKPPTTRGGWEKLYRENVALPQSERNRKARPGVINGVDIHRNYRPWQVFGLNPRTATRQDVEQAFRRLAKQVHPDAGGRRKDFERVKKLRDSVLAQMPAPKPAKGAKSARGSRKAAAKPAAPQGPKLLPPAREQANQGKPKRRKTEQQILEQVSRISEKAWGRDKTLSQRTLSLLDKAAGGVEARASRRMTRATANENRAYEKYNSVPGYPGSRTKTNRLRAERQGSARRTYRDLRDRAQDVRGNVQINAKATDSVKRKQYARSAAGRSSRRRQRAAENAASKAWVRGRR